MGKHLISEEPFELAAWFGSLRVNLWRGFSSPKRDVYITKPRMVL